MKRLVFVTLILAGMAAAQDSKITRRELIDSMEDSDSFGKTVNFAGVLRGGAVVLDLECVFPPGDLGPQDRCHITDGGPGLTTFDDRDLGSITFPGNTFKTNMYMIPSHFLDVELFNTTGVYQPLARFNYTPYITIESTALNDPRAVDPVTHVPLNGKLDINLSAARNIDRSLFPDERIHDGFTYSRALIAGINKGGLVDMGVPIDVSDRMFRNTMTIRMNMRGRTRLVDFAQMFYAIRILGN